MTDIVEDSNAPWNDAVEFELSLYTSGGLIALDDELQFISGTIRSDGLGPSVEYRRLPSRTHHDSGSGVRGTVQKSLTCDARPRRQLQLGRGVSFIGIENRESSVMHNEYAESILLSRKLKPAGVVRFGH